MCCSWQWVLTLSVSVPAFTEHETEVIADFILAGFAEFSGEVTDCFGGGSVRSSERNLVR